MSSALCQRPLGSGLMFSGTGIFREVSILVESLSSVKSVTMSLSTVSFTFLLFIGELSRFICFVS